MDTTDPCAYFNSFEIDLSPQSTAIDGSGERISQLRRRLMQFGKAMADLEKLEQEMQQQQKLRAQQALSDQIRILNDSIQDEKRKMTKLRQRAEHFLDVQCRKEFIPQTADLHCLLSQQFAESQHEVLERYKSEFADIRNNIKSEPSQILRLFHILFSIRDITKYDGDPGDQPPDLLMSMEEEEESKLEELPNEISNDPKDSMNSDLRSTQRSLLEYLSQTVPLIISQYQSAISRALRDISWPKMGDHKAMDMSSPSKWADLEHLCCDLFDIEYFIHFMTANHIFPEITNAVPSSSKSQRSWVIESFLEPIGKRFTFNFGGNRKSNRLDKPEWFLKFVLEVIEDNCSVLTHILQPLVDEQGVEVNVEREFISGLMDMVRSKCKENMNILMALHSNAVQRSRVISKRNELYQTSAEVTRTALKGMKVMTEMGTQRLQSLHSLYSSSLSALRPLRSSQSTGNNVNPQNDQNEHNDESDEEQKESENMEIKMERSKSEGSGTISTEMTTEDETERERRKQNDHRLKMVMLLIRHMIREMVTFQSTMNATHHWMRSDTESDSRSMSIITVILENELCAAEWLSMEKERMNEESVLINAQREVRWIFDLYHRQFVSRELCDYYLTNAVQDTLHLLEGIQSRIETIGDMEWRDRFVKELVIQVLGECALTAGAEGCR